MNEEPRYRVLDAARALGVEPSVVRRWLLREGIEASGPAGGLIGRRALESCLRRRDLALPPGLDPWPKVLVVDDHPDAARFARWTIEAALPFALLRCAGSGVEALDALPAFRPHLVVTDLRMPDGIDGFAVCERIAAERGLPEVKILVLSGDATPAAWARAFERGAAEYLRKPAAPQALAAAVLRLLELSEPARLS